MYSVTDYHQLIQYLPVFLQPDIEDGLTGDGEFLFDVSDIGKAQHGPLRNDHAVAAIHICNCTDRRPRHHDIDTDHRIPILVGDPSGQMHILSRCLPCCSFRSNRSIENINLVVPDLIPNLTGCQQLVQHLREFSIAHPYGHQLAQINHFLAECQGMVCLFGNTLQDSLQTFLAEIQVHFLSLA